jgi:MFS transporter, putative metabolite:H+ symporter
VPSRTATVLAILAAALGYFVDAYDLILYNIVRVDSLRGLGVPESRMLDVGVDLLNAQLIGMLGGGVLWGVWGDRRGRRSVLFGSIALYSLATLANGWVESVDAYYVCRLVAGIGLAGELGAGVTLVSELMPAATRGFGTMIVAAVGVVGVVTASLVGGKLDWRTAYEVGGALGLGLLVLRLGVSESGLFEAVREQAVSRGNLWLLVRDRRRLGRYLGVVIVALPIWFFIGVPVTFSPELGLELGLTEAPAAGRAVLFFYIGITLGDLTTGYLSQRWRTRKRVMAAFLGLSALFGAAYFVFGGVSLTMYYGSIALLGWASGYWAVFVTVAAEQFGTNLRATVATTAPNVVRGLVVPVTLAFKHWRGAWGAAPTAAVLGFVVLVLGFAALSRLGETFGRELDFLEE